VEQPIWITNDGREIPVKDMEYSHLLSVKRILIEQIEEIEDADEIWDSPRLFRGNFGHFKTWEEIISKEIIRREIASDRN